jgi:hypothetical protein
METQRARSTVAPERGEGERGEGERGEGERGLSLFVDATVALVKDRA